MPPAHNAKPWAIVYCQHCGKRMVPRDNERKHLFAKKLFCDRACMRDHRNGIAAKPVDKPVDKIEEPPISESGRRCVACKKELIQKRAETDGQFMVRAYCNAICFRLSQRKCLESRIHAFNIQLQEHL